MLLRERAHAAGGRLTDVAKDVVRNWSGMLNCRRQRFVFALDMCQPSRKAVHIGVRRKPKNCSVPNRRGRVARSQIETASMVAPGCTR